MPTKNDKDKDSTDIEGEPKKEVEVNLEDSKDVALEDKSLEERQKKVEAREEAVEGKLKEINETQEMFRKEWDEKIAEIDSLKELTETPDTDLEDVDFNEEDETKAEEEKTETEKEKPAAPTEGAELETGFENLVKIEIKEEKEFREKILKGQERIEQRFADTDLKEEISKAAKTYPKMDKREVLLEVHRDSSQDVMKLAEKSEKDFIVREDKMRDKVKDELKEEATGEKEEAEKTDDLPSKPASPTTPSPQEKSKDRWASATKEAQGDLEEGT